MAFYLDWIEKDPQTLLGTNIGAALKNALDVASKDDRKTRKIFVLLSDGEDYGGELTRQVAVYRQEGHHINSIGIGSDDEVPVPEIFPTARKRRCATKAGASSARGSRNRRCATIASTTGGRYLRSRTGGDLTKALQEIEQGERTLVGWRTTTEYRDLYPMALAVAAAAIALLWLFL